MAGAARKCLRRLVKSSKWREMARGLRNFWDEYRRYKSGLVGLVLLCVIIFMAAGAPLLASAEACENWDRAQYWEENPKGVPPEWIDWFSSEKLPRQEVLYPTVETGGPIWVPERATYAYAVFTYDFHYDAPPEDIKLEIEAEVAWRPGRPGKPAALTLLVYRPDGTTILLLSGKHYGTRKWISFSADDNIKSSLMSFGSKYETQENLEAIGALGLVEVMHALFSKTEPGILVGKSSMLKGIYRFVLYMEFYSEEDRFESARLLICGKVFGLLGTDANGKDLWVGLIWGSRLALVIGLVTAVVSTLVGVIYGVVSAYAGGAVDEFMQRVVELVSSIPLLPILIILSYYMEPTVWNIALIMAAFYWVGPVKTVRSMALQIKEEPYVEAAKAIGVGRWRLISRYIAAQIMPYTFAVMALSVPGAILTEAAVSFLLGGLAVRELTWGKILHEAQPHVLSGMWWWILPPGFMICVTGLAFVLIGNALDKILNPMLKR